MFSLLRQRTLRCPILVILPVLISVPSYLIATPACASAATLGNTNASAPVLASQQKAAEPGSTLTALTPEQRGDIYMARKEYAAALATYQKGTLTSAVLWNKMGMAYHHLYQLKKAQKAYQTALKLNPRYPEALNNLAAVYYSKRQYRKAEHTYQRALDYMPKAAVIYSNLGTSYIAEEKYSKGREAYQTALSLDPNVFHPDGSTRLDEVSTRQELRAIYFYLASAYAHTGNKAEALHYLELSFEEGLTDRRMMLASKDFDPIRATPEFQHLVAEQKNN